MMPGSVPLDIVPLWALTLILFTVSLVVDEWGFRVGRLRAAQQRPEADGTVGAVVAAQLALLAFLLALSFSIVVTRYEARRQMVLQEANAIGTAYLRGAMLPDPQAANVRRLLRDYTDARLDAAHGAPMDQMLSRSEKIHEQLWSEATAAAQTDARSVPIGLFIESLNDVIDLHSSRILTALRSRMPPAVWFVLFGVAFLSFFTMGYQGGLTKAGRSPAAIVFAVTFVVVIWLVSDLDRPGGFLRVSQEPMSELRKSMGQ